MKFNNLQESDLAYIRHIFKVSTNQTMAHETIMKRYGISRRKSGRWANKLSLTRKYDSEIRSTGKHNPILHNAKILVLDIETAPMMSYVWGIWQQNIGNNMSMLLSDWFMITWSAKWLFEDQVYSDKLTPSEISNEDDSRITKTLWDLIDQAHIIVAHNGRKFDMKRINTRFLKHGIKNPMPYQLIDTLEVAKKHFAISSNRLDYIGEFLGVGRKMKHSGFELWKQCMDGDQEALDEMEKYNIQDVRLLEDVYIKLRPYMRSHPNLGLFITDDVHSCPSCGGQDLERGGEYHTTVNTFEAFRCNSCGAIGRSRKAEKSNSINLLVPAAR